MKYLEPIPMPDYREPFVCPWHNCATDHGWCWECAVETYGYDKAKEIHDKEVTNA
jgi:hypothetical protein